MCVGVVFPTIERISRQDENGKVACRALLSHEHGEIAEILQEIDSLMITAEKNQSNRVGRGEIHFLTILRNGIGRIYF